MIEDRILNIVSRLLDHTTDLAQKVKELDDGLIVVVRTLLELSTTNREEIANLKARVKELEKNQNR